MMLGHASASSLTSASTFSPTPGLPDVQASTPYTTTPVLASLQAFRNPFAPGMDVASLQAQPPARPALGLHQRSFDAFYRHFHGGHPFVLPQEQFLRLSKDGATKLDALTAAMRYIGSLYIDAGPARAQYLDEALRLCYLNTTPRDGFLVQALLLLIVGLDGSWQHEKSNQLLADCERLALEINLNTRQFASMHGRSNPVLEESWRRTWWDLYVCDGMIAGVHRLTNFFLFDVDADVGLPCEEHQYLSGVRSLRLHRLALPSLT
jgi:hypothetical protein